MKKQYADSRTSREVMSRLRTNLRDVQNIMVTNIEDVISRGETLQGNKLILLFLIDI
jgi:hypoxanthine-guanine phosphoribosyltransferase